MLLNQHKTLVFDIGANIGRWTNANLNKYLAKVRLRDRNWGRIS